MGRRKRRSGGRRSSSSSRSGSRHQHHSSKRSHRTGRHSSSRSGSRRRRHGRHSHCHSRPSGSRRGHSRFYYSSSSDSDSLSEDELTSRKHGNPKKLPKNLHYDGKTSWLSFKQKFDSYRKVNKWSDGECRDYLNWCLEGKALDYFTIETHMGQSYSFREIMRKMEGRFGAKELPETSRTKFHQATQKPVETLEDWADRVLTLATPAFRELPESHAQREAIAKFCQGCLDKEAGKHACFERPKTIQQAVDLVRHHQYVTQVVDGKKPSKSKYDPDVSVHNVQSAAESRLERLEKVVESLASKVEASLVSNDQKKTPTTQLSSSSKSVKCFFCNSYGHIKKDCRKYKQFLKSKSGTGKGQEPLNGEGPAVKAPPHSPKK